MNLSFESLLILFGRHFVKAGPEGQLPFQSVDLLVCLLLDSCDLLPLPFPVDLVQVSQKVVHQVEGKLIAVPRFEVMGQAVSIVGDPVVVVCVQLLMIVSFNSTWVVTLQGGSRLFDLFTGLFRLAAVSLVASPTACPLSRLLSALKGWLLCLRIRWEVSSLL